MIDTGPSRFILINAGKYGYGEILVDRPVQLVGANNVGKTTLINALQFLLIDDERQMSFPKTLKETKAYYFRDTYSYVLLEIITPTGYRVLGAHGMGPIKNHNIERFAFEGTFEKEMFVDGENRVREFEAIKTLLVAKNFTTLEPRHLKAALTGIGDSKGVFLGFIPLSDSNHYPSFQAVFKNLLHLNNLRQDELKEVLLKVYQNSFSLDHIDLTDSYGKRFREILRQREGIRLLASVKPMVEDAQEKIKRQAELHGILPPLFAVIEQRLEVHGNRYQARNEAWDRELKELNEKQVGLKKYADELQDKRDTAHNEMGGFNTNISEIHTLGKTFASFSSEITMATLATQEEEEIELGARLKTASVDNPKRLKERIDVKNTIMKKERRLLEQTQNLLVTHLKKRFSDYQVDRLFTLLNPEMLHLEKGENGFVIKDGALLEQRLNALLKGMDDGGRYREESVDLLLKGLKSPDSATFTDPDRIKESLDEGATELAELEQRLEAAENAAELKAKKERLSESNKALQKQLFEFEQFLEKKEKLPKWEASKKKLEKELEELAKELTDNHTQTQELDKKKSLIDLEKREKARLYQNIVDRVQALVPPAPEWEGIDQPGLEQRGMEDLIHSYGAYRTEEDAIAREVNNLVFKINSKTSGSYSRGNDQETVCYLAEELEGLEEKEKANSHDWQDLVAGFGNSFKELNNSYETFKSRITALNRQLGKVSISNLTKLQLQVVDEHKWVGKVKQIAINQESPLFADMDAQEKIYTEFSEILKNIPSLHLRDLFTLHFVVENSDGNVTTYPNFDAIESNGTTITIKILVNLILLKSLFGKKTFRIPYYLDEAPNLSSENLQSILQVSKDLGFTPLLAGTVAVDAADILYFMKQHQGRIWMKPHFRMEIDRSMPDNENEQEQEKEKDDS